MFNKTMFVPEALVFPLCCVEGDEAPRGEVSTGDRAVLCTEPQNHH